MNNKLFIVIVNNYEYYNKDKSVRYHIYQHYNV